MNRMYKSATLKLTAWYLVLVMAISLVFSGVVYKIAYAELAQGLRNQTVRIYEQYPVFNNNRFFIRDDDLTTGSRRILLNLLYFNLFVLVAAGFAGYWLARRTLAPIEAANEQQKRFVADASHELRTPVAALKMETEVALMDMAASKETLRQALESNLEEADKLDTLLSSLLRLSKLESGDIRQAFTTLSVTTLAELAVAHTKQLAAAKGILIENTVTDHLVTGDADSLTQLLVILLDNAIKYSPEHATVTLASAARDHTVSLTIADNGIGIEPEALAHIFDRFYRADKARTGNNGYGLGLAIAKHIADLHDGTITIKSTPGKGTRAILQMPEAATGD